MRLGRLRPPGGPDDGGGMIAWIARLAELLGTGAPVVRMAVAQVQGSAPREPGASLLYWRDAQGRLCSHGSVGGGRLEERAMEIARYLLGEAPAPGSAPLARERRRMERFTLGASLGQCCGGVVELYWERFDHVTEVEGLLALAETADGHERLRYCALGAGEREWLLTADQARRVNLPTAGSGARACVLRDGPATFFVERLVDEDRPLWIYGAGHVGRALVRVLADLPFRIHWIDSRAPMLAEAMDALAPERRAAIAATSDEPDAVCATAPALAWHVVMTHCHDQDLRICEALMAHGRFGYLGVIGSHTKAARFRHRMQAKGHAPETVARMVCPIGIEGVHDKRPAAIAVAVAGQLLRQCALADAPAATPRRVRVATGTAHHD